MRNTLSKLELAELNGTRMSAWRVSAAEDLIERCSAVHQQLAQKKVLSAWERACMLELTGARSGEALGAKWRDLDWENAIWTVPKSKNGKTRFIYLNASAVSVFRQIQQKTRRMNLPVTSASPVFTNPKSKKAYKSFLLAWYAVREQLGLEDVRIHDLRHTYASLLVNKGVSLYEVQQLLGHSSAQMTQRYAHLAPNTLHRRTEIVEQIINPGLR